MIEILFLCHGNICRSPMAEFIFKDMVRKTGRENEFEIWSGAVSYEEEGSDLYPPAKRELTTKGIPFGRHRAHRISKEEYEKADLVIVMDESNIRLLKHIVGDDFPGKVHKLMEYTGSSRDVADPWYTRDFDEAYMDIYRGCEALLRTLTINIT